MTTKLVTSCIAGLRICTVVASLSFVAACSDRGATAIYKDSTHLPQSVVSDKHALNIVVNDTVRLVPTVYAVNGDSITEARNFTFLSGAEGQVRVSEDGLVRALETTDGAIAVQVRYSQDNVTVVDTVLVYVHPAPVVPDQFVFRLTADSARVGVGTNADAEAFIITAAGDTVTDIVTRYTSSAPTVLHIYRYSIFSYIQTRTMGSGKVYATATFGNQVFRDSVEIAVGYPAAANVGWTTGRWGTPDPLQVVIHPGGMVWWYNWGGETTTAVTFSDPSKALVAPDDPNAGSGNIPAFSGTRHGRRFVAPGTYTWTSGEQSGKIIVMPTFGPTP